MYHLDLKYTVILKITIDPLLIESSGLKKIESSGLKKIESSGLVFKIKSE